MHESSLQQSGSYSFPREYINRSFKGFVHWKSRTVMNSCISPNAGSCEHTLDTLRYADRVKSLSEGNGLKRDMSAANINLRESTSVSLSSNSHAVSTAENNKKYENTANGSDRIGWTKHVEKEASPPIVLPVQILTESRAEKTLALLLHDQIFTENKAQNPLIWRRTILMMNMSMDKGFWEIETGNHIYSQVLMVKEEELKHSPKSKDVNNDAYSFWSEEDFSALLMLEEDLVIAHCKQVEDTMDIVREEMELLDEADQPGNQLDDYISRLNSILSQKAAGIMNLQSRLAHF